MEKLYTESDVLKLMSAAYLGAYQDQQEGFNMPDATGADEAVAEILPDELENVEPIGVDELNQLHELVKGQQKNFGGNIVQAAVARMDKMQMLVDAVDEITEIGQVKAGGLFLRHEAGSATDPRDGTEYDLSANAGNFSPVIHSSKTGNWWTVKWEELIELAINCGIDKPVNKNQNEES